jgi:flavin reductase (DIM6/NTAB) family NADH-FMN oxidoreductase RutF
MNLPSAKSVFTRAPLRELPVTTTPPADSNLFRHSVAQFTTGIVIVSCDTADGGVHGMTVNSFTSVSLAPPTVLVSLKPGTAHRLLSQHGRFGASILQAHQQNLSAHFSGRPDETLRPEFITRRAQPTLKHCLAWFECEVIQQVEVYDHSLFVAHVVSCGNESGAPLMYFGSQYRRAEALA